jgi:hypothetical protein
MKQIFCVRRYVWLNFVRDGSGPRSGSIEKELLCLVEVRLEAMAAKIAGDLALVEGALYHPVAAPVFEPPQVQRRGQVEPARRMVPKLGLRSICGSGIARLDVASLAFVARFLPWP